MDTKSFIISEKQMELDFQMVPFDLWAGKAHILMLCKQKIITKAVTSKILGALGAIEKEFLEGNFAINPDLGLTLTIESKVVEKIGGDGYFMHTGRSRNDQIATVELLYLREQVLGISDKLLKLLKSLKILAEENITAVMPGYTHMQPAKPTTFGQWSVAYFDMLLRSFDTLKYVWESYDLCPLGAAESYGTRWKIDRSYTSQLLGFKNVWEIPQDAISSRGFVQLALLGVLKDIGIAIGKLSTDLLLFTTFEYGYIKLQDNVAREMSPATGSSIMPQKKNPDVLELLRAAAPQLIGFQNIVANLLSGLPMGYNRDTREVKEYIDLGMQKTGSALNSLTQVLGSIEINREKMLAAVLKNYSLAADLADYISQKYNLPYRKVYKLIGEAVINLKEKNLFLPDLSAKYLHLLAQKHKLDFQMTEIELNAALDPHKLIQKRLHAGGAAQVVMEKILAARSRLLVDKAQWIKIKKQNIEKAKRKTAKAIESL